MEYVAERFRGMKAGLSLDADALSRYSDLIDLSIGDTDFITDRRIIDAAYKDACAGYTRYGFPKGDPELVQAVRRAWREDFGQAVPEDEVIITASSCLGMSLVMTAILDPGDEVLVPGPYFAVYKQQIELAGGVCVEVPTYEEDGYALRPELFEKAVTPRTKAVMINNPNNPTGAGYGREQLEVLRDIAIKHDLLVIADEIYTRYMYEGEFIPVRTLSDMEERTVTLNSFSKNFMMTGWRVGYIIAPSAIIEAVNCINGGMIYTTPSVSQRAAIKALTLRDEIQREYISQYKSRVYYAADRISDIPYMTVLRPKGTFYLFPGITRTGMDSKAFCAYLLENAHVLVSPGTAFGISGAGHIRIAVTAPMEKLAEAFDRMERLKFD